MDIYLKEGIDEDDQVFAVWEALRGRGRPQDVFRRALREGIRVLALSGELPRAAFEGLDPILLGAVPPAHAMMIATEGRERRLAKAAAAAIAQPPKTAPRQPARPGIAARPPRQSQDAPPSATERISMPDGPGYPSGVAPREPPDPGTPEGGAPGPSDNPRPKLKPLMG